MIRVRKEGQPVRFGFNFYPLNDAYSMGVVIGLGAKTLMLRWSKVRKKMTVRMA